MVSFFSRIYYSMMVLVVPEENASAELDADSHLLEQAARFVGQGMIEWRGARCHIRRN
jgi:hypothetical protein